MAGSGRLQEGKPVDGTDLLIFPHFMIALLAGILSGVIAVHIAQPDLVPCAAIAGFSLYLSIVFLVYFNRWLRTVL